MSNRRTDPTADSRDNDPDGREDAQEANGEAAQGAADATDATDATESAGDPLARAAKLEAEAAELRDQLLRALAEAENQRRRSQREREDAVRYAAAPLVRDLLAVADNLSRALESVPSEAAGAEETLETLLEGVRLTEKELQSAFERHGIVKLEPLGERLDPHRHEAMFEVPDPDQPAGTIAQVIQPGYLLHDRLLRPARVGVAKGGPPAKRGGNEAVDPDATEPENGQPGGRVDTSA